MTTRIFQVDAFADGPYQGNPAAVCLVKTPLPAALMQSIAAEMRHSETAFVEPADAAGVRPLRWFTPAAEVDLCGHATLAAASIVLDGATHDGSPATPSSAVAFSTRSGVLNVSQAADGLLTMTLPVSPIESCEPPPGLLAALGLETARECFRTRFDCLVVLDDVEQLMALTPDFRALSETDVRGVIVTTPAPTNKAPTSDEDFASRFFAPRVGVDEDPVTGSAHCALAPYWSRRLERADVVGRQMSPRSGVVRCRWDGGDTVALSGRTVRIYEGRLSAAALDQS